MKRFLRAQEKGKFKDISNFIFPDNILNNINFINQQFGYYKLRYDAFCDDSDDVSDSDRVVYYDSDSDSDSDEYNEDSDSDNGGVREYLVDGKPYPGFIEFYDIFKKIFNQIKNESCDSDCDSDEYDSDREELDLSYTDSDLEDFCNHLNSFFS